MQDWVRSESENLDVGDVRLNNKLAGILDTLSHEPIKSIPCASDAWAEANATYRFLDNEKVTFDSVMSGHRAATLDRIKKEPVVRCQKRASAFLYANQVVIWLSFLD